MAEVEQSKEEEGGEEAKVERLKFRGEGENVGPLQRTVPFIEDGEYLTERVDGQINYFNAKSSKSQKQYKKLKKREFLISAFIPFLIMVGSVGIIEKVPFIGFALPSILQILAALGGVYLAYLTQDQDLEKHFNIWKEYRSTCEQLQHEKYLYLAKAEPYDEEDAYPIFVTGIENILHKDIQRWMQIQKNDQKKKEEKKSEDNK